MMRDDHYYPPEEAPVPQEDVNTPTPSLPEEDSTFSTTAQPAAAPSGKKGRKRLTAVAAVLAAAGISTLAGTTLNAVTALQKEPTTGQVQQETTESMAETAATVTTEVQPIEVP